MTRPFFETLRELRGGQTLLDLAEDLANLVGKVRITGKPGKLRLTIAVKPASKSDARTLLIEDAIELKEPKLDRAATVFYSTADNTLTRQDPQQRDFILEPVAKREPPAGVDPVTGEILAVAPAANG